MRPSQLRNQWCGRGSFRTSPSGGCDGELVFGGWSPGGDGWSPAVFSVRRRYPVAKMTRVWHENATSYIFCTCNATGGPKKGAIYRLLRRRAHGHDRGPRSRHKHGSPPIEGPPTTQRDAWSRSPGPRVVRATPIIGPNHQLVYAAPPIWAPRTREASCPSTVPVRPGRLDRLQPDRTAARLRKKGPDATVKLPTTAPVSS